MKKLIMMLICLFMMLAFVTSNNSENILKANDVDFENFNFSSSKIRENGKIKVKIVLEWQTNNEIEITSITTKINGQTQITSKIDKESAKKEDDYGNKYYYYNLSYNVEHWQIGTMVLQINYFNVENGDSFVKEYCIPGDKWLEEEVSWGVAISFGIFVTFCVGIATYIIIENSKKGYLELDADE